MRSLHTCALSTPSVSSILEFLVSTRGIQQRVAKSLGIHKSVVSRVANGKKTSSRISAALAAEIARINQTVLSGVKDAPAKKPRIRLHCFLACNNGDVYANYDGSCVVTRIGRNTELERTVEASRFIYPRGSLIPIELYREATA